MPQSSLERAKELVMARLRAGRELGTDELVIDLADRQVSPVDVRRAAWYLVDSGQAVFTPDLRLRAAG